MKKLFAMLLALTMTFQLITPAWADAAEAPEEVTEASEVVEEVEEEIPETTEEETTEVPEETLPEETTEATEEETEVTDPALEELPDEEELTMEEVPEEEVALQSGEDVSASGTCGANVNWVLTTDGTLTISGAGAMEDYSSSDTVPGYKNRNDIVNVLVKSGVTYLGSYAFSDCTSLTSVTILEGVTSIGNGAFADCSGLTSATIPEGVTSIENWAFYACFNLTSVYIPKTVRTIETSALYNGGCLKEIYYGGTDIDWKQITIKSNNFRLSDVTIHYNATHICKLVLTSAKVPTCTESGNNAYYT